MSSSSDVVLMASSLPSVKLSKCSSRHTMRSWSAVMSSAALGDFMACAFYVSLLRAVMSVLAGACACSDEAAMSMAAASV